MEIGDRLNIKLKNDPDIKVMIINSVIDTTLNDYSDIRTYQDACSYLGTPPHK
ncbi:MAG: hypothetical protein LBE13_17380 [Bacteroidales bacterium]|jgi:hypothetical protein|nr:hypothetical protein [Bacteroidales bacterium]